MNRGTRIGAAIALAVLLAGRAAAADERCSGVRRLVVTGMGTWSEELSRLADLAPGALAPQSGIMRRGGLTTRPLCDGAGDLVWGDRYVAGTELHGLDVVPPRLTGAYQATSPGGSNDGLLWQGRGFSALLSGGLRGSWGAFSMQLAPEVTWSQNAYFKTVDTGRPGNLAFANPWYTDALDVPQRFGAGPFARASMGQSYAQVAGFGWRAGVSTESLWWGPGIRNAILLTNNAEGFPHAFVGTARPVDIWVGTLELELLWGDLSRSDYNYTQDHMAFNALGLVYQPRWIPGLYLGGARTYVETWSSLRDDHYLSVINSIGKSSSPDGGSDNQMASVWIRWVMPEIELYGEYAQDDFQSFSGFVRQPDRAGAYTLGFQKRWVLGPRWWRVVGELARTASNLPPPEGYPYYTHGHNADYTVGGQLLGDWIGPGADTQYLGIDAFYAGGRIGGYVERVRRNEEVFQERFAAQDATAHDVDMVVGVRGVVLTRALELSWDVAGGQRSNRDFMDNEPVFRVQVNVAIPFGGPRPRAAELPSPPAEPAP